MIEVRDLSVTYHDADEPALSHIDMNIMAGQLTLIVGATGSGKTSLLLSLNGIVHHETSARMEGEIRLNRVPIQEIPLSRICKKVGTVFQNPSAQICTGTPEREIAFGLENLGIPRPMIKQRIDEVLALTGLQKQRFQKSHTLSGGQQQRLVIAAALALNPEILLLDEPRSQLDPAGAEEIIKVLKELKERLRIAIVMAEHRLEGPMKIADQVVLLDQGRIVQKGSKADFLKNLSKLQKCGLQTPPLLDLFQRIRRKETPLSAQEAPLLIPKKSPPVKPKQLRSDIFVKIDDLDFSYPRQAFPVFSRFRLRIYRGDRIALLGGNGAGKSTLLHLLSGSLTPDAGTIAWQARPKPTVGLVLQNPDLMLVTQTVKDELWFAPRQSAIGPNNYPQSVASAFTVRSVLEKMSLASFADRAPFALSRGERQRTAVGSVLTQRPELLLLDEPTTGQDRIRIDKMMRLILHDYQTVVFSTHDVETAGRHANRIVLLREGEIVADGEPEEVLFDLPTLQSAFIRPSELHLFAKRHGVVALEVDSLVEVFG